MDKPVVLAGSTVTAAATMAALLRGGTPEALVAALVAAGAVTGALSRSFQAEFMDAYVASAIGFVVGVNATLLAFDGVAMLASLPVFSNGSAAYVYIATFSVISAPVFGLFGALGGGLGVRLRPARSGRPRLVDGALKAV